MTADPQIIEQARSADPDARQKAASLVAQSADERNLPLMFELLGDKDWRVRKTIVDGFVRDARPEIVRGLIDALADAENAGKRNSATEALIRIGEPAIEPHEHEEARRLARLILSDIIIYHQAKVERGIRDNNFFEILREEIEEGRQYYDSRVPLRVRRDTEIYTETIQQFVQMKREELQKVKTGTQ
ncbi:MAG TPA: HEAT repeat domain-containing protein [Thermoanaerobaculia bacterium]|nr:HEAT repeat domain-containing protein [Thermoanaerobaculia bacterium]